MARLSNKQAARELLDSYKIKPPKSWDKLSAIGQLDYIATRILAGSRTTTSHREMREEGILSVSQYERRLAREVYSSYGTLDGIPPERGVFGRRHVRRPKSTNRLND